MTDLYFVGFAPYASEDVFRKDMEVARDLFDDRFDTDGRSIVLINNPRTVLDQPLATVSNLRTTLKEIGVDDRHRRRRRDGVPRKPRHPRLSTGGRFLAAATRLAHAAACCAACSTSPGIKWRIIVVSACYSGGFVDAAQGRAHADHDRVGGQSDVLRLRQRKQCDVLWRCAVPACAALRGFVRQGVRARHANASPSASARKASARHRTRRSMSARRWRRSCRNSRRRCALGEPAIPSEAGFPADIGRISP